LNRSALGSEKISHNAGSCRPIAEHILRKILKRATVETLTPHGGDLLLHLPLVTCWNKNERSRAIVLEDPADAALSHRSMFDERNCHSIRSCLKLRRAHPLGE